MKVWITDDVHPMLPTAFASRGYEVVYEPNVTLAKVHEQVHEYAGLIINSKIIADKSLLSKGTKLKFIGRLGSGLDIIDLPYAAEKGIAVHSAPEGNRNAVAEHALGMLFSLTNNLCRADRQVRLMQWEREQNRGFEIAGKTIGIIGYGNNGSAFVQKLAGLGLNVLIYDKYKIRYADNQAWIQETTFDALLENSDIVSLHIPLTAETHHMVDEQFISQWKPNGILINTSRGGIVKTSALVSALESKRVAGACLDVFENEKPHTFTPLEFVIYKKLYKMQQVILSPHVAGWTYASKRKIAEVLIQKILN